MMLSMYLLLALTGFEPESNPFQNTQRSVLLCESLRLELRGQIQHLGSGPQSVPGVTWRSRL